MLITIIGGAASGKSEFGENIAVKLGNKKLYIATMQPFGNEAQQKIKRHTELRETKGFQTVEKYNDLSELTLNNYDTVLLECVSTLLANEFFSSTNYFDKIINGIKHINQNSNNVIVITNKIFSDGVSYDEQTTSYMKAFGEINKSLFLLSDVVIEVVFGIPIFLKGKEMLNDLVL